jgi:ribonuclease Y
MITIIVAIAALALGTGIGYYLRMIKSLGQKGSIELEIKEMLVGAKEEASRIVDEAKKKADDKERELRDLEREKDDKFKETEKRLIKKEELLDTRQIEIDREVENIKTKIEEIKKIKERVDNAHDEKRKELERVAGMKAEEARDQLMVEVERKYEEDFLVRMQKLEQSSQDKLDRRAKDILSTTIQRLSSSTASEMMTTAVSIPERRDQR